MVCPRPPAAPCITPLVMPSMGMLLRALLYAGLMYYRFTPDADGVYNRASCIWWEGRGGKGRGG